MLKAFETVLKDHPNIQLEIVGGGPMHEKLESWIITHNLQKSVTMYGWQENSVGFMKSWDCFLFTSLREGLPCSIVEARFMKIPVLSYDTGGIGDIITNGKNGFLYKKHDWNSLSCGMIDIIQDNTLRKRLSNFDDAIEAFSSSYMIKEHIIFYDQL